MSDVVICVDCAVGYYHSYNGVWLCAYCGQPKEKAVILPEELTNQKLVKPATRTRRKRTSDE